MSCSTDAPILKQREASLWNHLKKSQKKGKTKKKRRQGGGCPSPKKVESIFLFYNSLNLNLRVSEGNYTNKTHTNNKLM